MSYFSKEKRCSHCDCLVDAHFENKHNCLNLRCECPEVDHVPRKRYEAHVVKDNRPHMGTCDCRDCIAWLRRNWSGYP